MSCKGSAGPAGYQCASIPVPRNPLDPAAGTIEMALDRRPAPGTRIGSLLVNPGGPGVSGVDFLPTAVSYLSSSILHSFDIVGFDPPGVGRTAPVACLPDAALAAYLSSDPAPATAAGLAANVALDRNFAAGCQQRSAVELPYTSTVDAAMDMEYVRKAVGDRQLTYLGFSYGTFLGATYADLFPHSVRAMVLDGALDPSLDPLQSVTEQAGAFDAELNVFFNYCATTKSCPWHPGADPLRTYEALTARVEAKPLAVKGTSRTVGPAALLYATAAAMYSTGFWPALAEGLAEAQKGDGKVLLELFDLYTGRRADGSYSNEFEANPAVACLDAPVPPVAQIEAAAASVAASAPVFGRGDVLGLLQCAVWPIPAQGSPHALHAAGAPPILVVGSTGDPATPYPEAQALASELSSGVLLTRVGYGHTAYPYSSCVRKVVDAYLTTLAVPARGTTCQS